MDPDTPIKAPTVVSRVIQHETFSNKGESRISVQNCDDDWHICAANRRCGGVTLDEAERRVAQQASSTDQGCPRCVCQKGSQSGEVRTQKRAIDKMTTRKNQRFGRHLRRQLQESDYTSCKRDTTNKNTEVGADKVQGGDVSSVAQDAANTCQNSCKTDH